MSVEQSKGIVEDYVEKLEQAINITELDMSENSQIATFIKRLRKYIKRTILLQPFIRTLTEAISNAIGIEDGLKIIRKIAPTINFAEQDKTAIMLAAFVDQVKQISTEMRKDYPSQHGNQKDNGQNDRRSNRNDVTCYYCGCARHLVQDCRTKKRDMQMQSNNYNQRSQRFYQKNPFNTYEHKYPPRNNMQVEQSGRDQYQEQRY